MKTILSYILSPIVWLLFGLFLVIFDVLQMLAYYTLGFKSQQKMVKYLNFCLTKIILIAGINIRINWIEKPTLGKPYIIVANHQSLYDIPPITWFFRAYIPKFISKIELAKGVPSISFNLRKGGGYIIDRKQAGQAIEAIKLAAKDIEKNNSSVVIFPEGTRSKNGIPKKWRTGGLQTLVTEIPDVGIIPVTIDGSWKIVAKKGFLIPIGGSYTITVHPVEYIKKTDDFNLKIAQIKQIVDSKITINN